MSRPPEPTREVGKPEPGYFRMRLVAKGWRAPCRIVFEAELWWAVIDGEAMEPAPDPVHAPGVFRIWHGGTRIEEAEYRWLEQVREWAKQHEPTHPAANTMVPMNANTTPPVRP